jgi:pyridinium-3,5-bisthiocarboxylic acid mononucleotide nickel chelatase
VIAAGRTGYLDCFSGAGGDMILAALVAAGLPATELLAEIDRLALPGLTVRIEEQSQQAIGGIRLTVIAATRQELRTLPAIRELLERSPLSPRVRKRSLAVFTALAEAEARVHAVPVERVHFHEVGALDTIVDVVGTVFGLDRLGIEHLVCSPLPLGRGFVRCAHGLLPLPAPAVCELLHGVPTYGVELSQELVTPTAAALIATLADGFGPLPAMQITGVGYGIGSHQLANGQPNLLRLLIGTASEVEESQLVEVIETNMDDWSPEGFPHLCDLLFAGGALDVSLSSIQMKKGRPGFTLQVISPLATAHPLKELILTETTAIGLRFRREERRTLPRQTVTVKTRWGEIPAKRVVTPGGATVHPEYEACRLLAIREKLPLQRVYHEVRERGREQQCQG